MESVIVESVIVAERGAAYALGSLFTIVLWVAAIVWLVRWWRARSTGKMLSTFDTKPSFAGGKPVPLAQRHAQSPETSPSSGVEPRPGDSTAPTER